MIYEIDVGRKLWFSDDARRMVENSRQMEATDLEAGGILLGRRFIENRDIIIDEISLPQANDKRFRHSIYRSADHEKIALNRWRSSGRTELYLGLWHTHAEKRPSPSKVDIDDWEKAMINGKYDGSEMFFVIVGTEEVACWRGELSLWNMRFRRTLKLSRLRKL